MVTASLSFRNIKRCFKFLIRYPGRQLSRFVRSKFGDVDCLDWRAIGNEQVEGTLRLDTQGR